jgi:hypothetical protein
VKSSKVFLNKEIRYGHSYQLGVEVSIVDDNRILESGDNNRDRTVLGRKGTASGQSMKTSIVRQRDISQLKTYKNSVMSWHSCFVQ